VWTTSHSLRLCRWLLHCCYTHRDAGSDRRDRPPHRWDTPQGRQHGREPRTYDCFATCFEPLTSCLRRAVGGVACPAATFLREQPKITIKMAALKDAAKGLWKIINFLTGRCDAAHTAKESIPATHGVNTRKGIPMITIALILLVVAAMLPVIMKIANFEQGGKDQLPWKTIVPDVRPEETSTGAFCPP